jgi:ABC-type phosphate transport system substrate-binding protein
LGLAGVSVAVVALSGGSALSKEGPSGFQVVVHPENPTGSVGRDFLEQAFLKRKTRWPDDETVRPVDQRADSAVRERFSEVVLRRSVAAVKRYWQQQIFTGRGVPPPELDTDRAVVEYVRRHRGAVGYVAESADVGAVKTISFR